MSEPRAHHFISKCYLKGFSADGSGDSQLFVIDANSGRTFSTTPANVGHERDFNAIEGLAPGELEKKLSKVESDIAPALERVIANRSIENRDDWTLVLNLIALFAMRNPRWREQVGGFMADISRKIMAIALATPERWASQIEQMQAAGFCREGEREVTYEEMKEFIESGEYDIKVARSWQIGMEFKTFEPVLKSMVKRAWTLILTDDQTGHFITTDHPVCLSHGDFTLGTLQRPLGHGTPGSRLFLPVNRHMMAVGTLGETGGIAKESEYDVALLNGIVAPFAYRHIFASSPDFKVMVAGIEAPMTGAEMVSFIAARYQATEQKKEPPDQ
jgi:hypothetical protein